MMPNCIPYIATKISDEIISAVPVSGGDISAAYRVDTKAGRYFLKVNSASSALEMFEAEQKGLQAIENTKTIAVPRVHLVDATYHEIIPQSPQYDIQIELYQLYYLLAHLNLFGSSYYSSVASILKKHLLYS